VGCALPPGASEEAHRDTFRGAAPTQETLLRNASPPAYRPPTTATLPTPLATCAEAEAPTSRHAARRACDTAREERDRQPGGGCRAATPSRSGATQAGGDLKIPARLTLRNPGSQIARLDSMGTLWASNVFATPAAAEVCFPACTWYPQHVAVWKNLAIVPG